MAVSAAVPAADCIDDTMPGPFVLVVELSVLIDDGKYDCGLMLALQLLLRLFEDLQML